MNKTLHRQHARSIVKRYSILALSLIAGLAEAQVTNVADLVNAVNNGSANSTVLVAAGTFRLTAPLSPKAGMTIRGAGVGRTIITGASTWEPSTSSLPDPEITTTGLDSNAYLFRFPYGFDAITISDMTLTGPLLHGAIFSSDNDGIHLYNLRIDDFRWCGIRTFYMDNAKIHDCEFVNSGGRWSNGSPGVSGGINGGALFVTYMTTSEIWNNRFTRTKTEPQHGFFGIKGRKGLNSRLHHNTINVDFSIEFPFENDQFMEIDHNICKGVISIPKDGGGSVPTGGYTFHIHHNYFTTPYAIELARNGVEVDHNLFDFRTNSDYGNLFSSFSSATAGGPVRFHNNLVKNPGRGVFWAQGPYNNISFYNNHVIGNTTITPRTEGLFGFNPASTMSTVTIKDNIIELIGQTRPLVRNTASHSAVIQNNTLINVSGTSNYANANTGAKRGLTAPLLFTCGVNDESTVDGWNFGPSPLMVNTSADTYSRSGTYASTNYGASTQLVVKSTSSSGYTRRSYLKFPVSALANSGTISLILHVDALGAEGTSGYNVELRQMTTDTWTESGLTWNNQPAMGSLISSFSVLQSDVGHDLSLDVSSYVRQQAAGDGTASFVLVQPANTNRAVFFSTKEGTQAPILKGTP